MNAPYGTTRTRVAARHALIAPDGHVKSNVPGISGAVSVILISPAMGAGFAQLLVTFAVGGRAALPADELETVGYIETGGALVTVGGSKGGARPADSFLRRRASRGRSRPRKPARG